MTTVADIMTRDVRTMAPTDSVVQAAQAMQELNVGVIPVCEGSKIVGMVTDRDIALGDVANKDFEDQEKVAASLSDISAPAQPDRAKA